MAADVIVENSSSIVSLTPITPAAREWIKENCQTEPWQWLGPTLNIDTRYAGNILEGMQADGLTIE
jgi:hypothetical protein